MMPLGIDGAIGDYRIPLMKKHVPSTENCMPSTENTCHRRKTAYHPRKLHVIHGKTRAADVPAVHLSIDGCLPLLMAQILIMALFISIKPIRTKL